MVVIVFRSRLREGMEEEITALGTRLYEIVSGMPGFRSYKDFAAEDGEFVTIAEFETMADVDEWSRNPEHVLAKRLGREELFSEYHIQVCEVMRVRSMPAKGTPSSGGGR